jgi:manganese/zinc/iron transport system substrate-binding protein
LGAAFAPRAAIAAESRLSIVATTGMIADTARAIGGELVEVKALMGPGVDPHAYRQTRTDILAMRRADLILWNGLYLEAQMEEVLGDLSGLVPVRAVAETIPAEQRIAHDDYADRFDPHVWMDPALWREVSFAIRDAMFEAARHDAAAFTANAEAYTAEMDVLASYANDVLGSVPEERRVLLTAHDAFNYFGRAYGYEVIGIQGISTESEAGLNRITELVNLLVDRGIAAVFVESSVSDRSIRALIEGAAAEGHEVRIGGELYSDAMGSPGTYEGTYVGMIDHNATVIATALGGEAPERGMTGKLSAGS